MMREPRVRNASLLLGRRAAGVPQPTDHARLNGSRSTAHTSELVFYDGDAHAMTIGTTGSGKTAQIIANVLRYDGPMVIFDSKSDVFQATARHRREMGEVHVIDMRGLGGTGGLNPMDLSLRCGDEKAVAARSLAGYIVMRTGAERDPFWIDSSETQVAGGISYAFELPAHKRNLGTVYDLYNQESVSCGIHKILNDKNAKLTRSARAAFESLLQMPDRETRPSVIASTQATLRLWDSELVRRATQTTTFDLDALIAGEEPLTIYIIVPSYRDVYRPLLRMWFNGLLAVLMQRPHLPSAKTLIISDETASFGRVEGFLTAATQARSYGVQLWTHFQNTAQLQIYGEDGARTLIDNAGVLQLLGAPNRRMAQEFISLVGGIDADEVMKMGPRDQLVMQEGRLMRLQRIRYFEEEMFAGQYDSVKQPRSLALSKKEAGKQIILKRGASVDQG